MCRQTLLNWYTQVSADPFLRVQDFHVVLKTIGGQGLFSALWLGCVFWHISGFRTKFYVAIIVR